MRVRPMRHKSGRATITYTLPPARPLQFPPPPSRCWPGIGGVSQTIDADAAPFRALSHLRATILPPKVVLRGMYAAVSGSTSPGGCWPRASAAAHCGLNITVGPASARAAPRAASARLRARSRHMPPAPPARAARPTAPRARRGISVGRASGDTPAPRACGCACTEQCLSIHATTLQHFPAVEWVISTHAGGGARAPPPQCIAAQCRCCRLSRVYVS